MKVRLEDGAVKTEWTLAAGVVQGGTGTCLSAETGKWAELYAHGRRVESVAREA